jgi:RsiW-degrading membrane proteinase PrsW (M82 family)
MPVLASLFFGFIPMLLFAVTINWLDRYEKEPKILLAVVFVWGAVVAAGVAFVVNTIFGVGIYAFTGQEAVADIATGSLVAPVVEEILKGMAVVLVFLLFRSEFDSVLDGIVYAATTALGFAATENTLYIYRGFQESGWSGLTYLVFVRVILVGWQHPFYTAFTGIGLAVARLETRPWLKLLAPFLGLAFSIAAHSFHNTFASIFPGLGGLAIGTLLDWSGWSLMLIFIVAMIYREKQLIVQYLMEEIELGIISAGQYATAKSAFSQGLSRFGAIFQGSFGRTRRFYQLCGELVHKKHQMLKFGDEEGNQRAIQRIRHELKQLSPGIR